MDSSPAIALIPYGTYPNFGLRKISLDDLEWPIGRPERLSKGTISDMRKTDHLITNPRKSVFLFPRFKVKAQISVVICEPDIIHKKYINWLRFLHWRFYKVLTRSEALLGTIKNGVFFLYASTFIKNINNINTEKKELLSLIASNKNTLEGHKLRHTIVNYIRNNNINADIMGRGYKSFEDKEDGLAPYYFSVIIENNQEPNYFTEKLLDCCICETIPIYWGAPNIEKHFDVRGMIICNTELDIIKAINNINLEYYKTRLEWVKENRKKALTYIDFEVRVAKCIKTELINNR